MILHDPQTAGLVDAVRRTGAAVIWRCHVGVDHPNSRVDEAWSFMRRYLRQRRRVRLLRAQFAWDGLDPRKIAVIHPSIDPFSAKNQDQTPAQTLAILTSAGVVADGGRKHATFTHGDETPGRIDRAATLLEAKPLTPGDRFIVQVSRWDRLKDPLGVMAGFARHVADRTDAHLVLAGPATDSVTDDPEGAAVFGLVRDAWHQLPHAIQGRVHVASLPMTDIGENAAIVNALQRRAAVVVQKSIAEGFGLTVAEAMWKERAVVASAVGGIQDQIVDGESGVLLSDPRDLAAFGSAVVDLLEDRERARRMGVAARARIQDEFLGPRHLGRHFELIERVMSARRARTRHDGVGSEQRERLMNNGDPVEFSAVTARYVSPIRPACKSMPLRHPNAWDASAARRCWQRRSRSACACRPECISTTTDLAPAVRP